MPANAEVAVRAEGVTKWRNSSSTVTVASTLGFAEGGLKYQIKLQKMPVYKNDGSFGNWKETKQPLCTISVNKLYQDSSTELINSGAGNSLQLKASGQSVATGTLSHEIKQADGVTWDCAHFANATLMNVSLNQADPYTLDLQFEAVGWPTLDNTQA